MTKAPEQLLAMRIGATSVGENLRRSIESGRLIEDEDGTLKLAGDPNQSLSWMYVNNGPALGCGFLMEFMFHHAYAEAAVPHGCSTCYKVKVVPRTLRELVAAWEIGKRTQCRSKWGTDLNRRPATRISSSTCSSPRLTPTLPIFTNTGRVYWLKVYEIPDVSAAGKGKHVGNLVALQPGETVRTMLAVRNLEEEGRYIFFATRNGTVKKTELKDFSHVMSRGIIAINIEKGDELVGVTLTDGSQIVFLASHDGQAIRFDEDDVRRMGRPAYGVRGMRLDTGDYIVGMATTPKDAKKAEAAAEEVKAKTGVAEVTATDETLPIKGSLILSVTENGYGKRTPADEYRLQGRGGSGVINVKTTARNGKVTAIAQVTEDSEVMLISQYGKIIRMDSSTIRESGRAAQGVRLLQLEPGDRVAAAVVIPPEEEPTNGGTLIQ